MGHIWSPSATLQPVTVCGGGVCLLYRTDGVHATRRNSGFNVGRVRGTRRAGVGILEARIRVVVSIKSIAYLVVCILNVRQPFQYLPTEHYHINRRTQKQHNCKYAILGILLYRYIGLPAHTQRRATTVVCLKWPCTARILNRV